MPSSRLNSARIATLVATIFSCASTLRAADLTWYGFTNVANSNWTTDQTVNNWQDDSTPPVQVPYNDGDAVSFLDVAPGTPTSIVVQAAGVSPASVSVDSSLNYFISGGSIKGTTAVFKKGTGTLSLGSANDYSGGTSLLGGDLTVGDNKALGTGPLTLSSEAPLAPGLTMQSVGSVTLANDLVNSTLKTTTFTGFSNITFGGNVSLKLNAKFSVDTQSIVTFKGVVQDAGGARSLSKDGEGTLVLSSANTYTGGTTLLSGGIVVGNDSALGDPTKPLNVPAPPAPALIPSLADDGVAAHTISNPITLNNTLGIFPSKGLTLTGVISGAGALFISAPFGPAELDPANMYSGGTTIDRGTVALKDDKSLGTGPLTITGNATLTAPNADRTLANPVHLIGGALTIGGTRKFTFNGATTVEGLVPSIDVVANNTATFTGAISDGATTGAGLYKGGPGTLAVSGNNTYTGITVIAAGTFLANNTAGSATGNGDVHVFNGATLGGNGKIAGKVMFDDGAHLAPGNSPGQITLGTTVLSDQSQLDYDLDKPNLVGAAGNNDLTTVLGGLTLDGVLNVTAGPNFGAGTYRIFNYTGSLTDNTLQLGTFPSGYSGTIDTSVNSEVNLIVKAVPEPAVLALFMASSLLVLRPRR